MDEIHSFCEKPYGNLRKYLPLPCMFVYIKLGRTTTLSPYLYFVSQFLINYPFVHPHGTVLHWTPLPTDLIHTNYPIKYLKQQLFLVSCYDRLELCSLYRGYIPWILLKLWVLFVKPWTLTGSFANSADSTFNYRSDLPGHEAEGECFLGARDASNLNYLFGTAICFKVWCSHN